MRVAFSGTHRVGKTTLLEAVSGRLPTYQVLDEPYRLLEEEGHEFSDPPAVEDFECQLRRSIDAVEAAPVDALLDRCPLDFIAYVRALEEDFDLEEWLPELRDAMEAIDLIVVLSIEAPDRIALPSHEDRRLRRKVDAWIRRLVLDDPHGFGTAAVEVYGDVEERVRQVMGALR